MHQIVCAYMRNPSFLFLLLSFFCANIQAQSLDRTKLDVLSNEFIQKAESSEALGLLTRIKSYYLSLSAEDKDNALSILMDKAKILLKEEQKDETLAIIFLYQNLADANNAKLPTLIYIKGIINADKNDSIQLKRTIEELDNQIFNNNQNTQQYLKELKHRLDELRSFIPLYQKLEGYWVGDNLLWDKKDDGNTSIVGAGKSTLFMTMMDNFQPDLSMRLINDLTADTMSVCLLEQTNLANQLAAKMSGGFVNLRAFSSQIVIPFGVDSLYILWSSERINKNSPELSGFMRESVSATSALVNAELAQRNKYSWSTSFVGGLTTSFVEYGINSLIDELFQPSKKMFALEARLRIVNDYMLTGKLTFKYSKIKADGNGKYEEQHSNVELFRWMPESNTFFLGLPAPASNENANQNQQKEKYASLGSNPFKLINYYKAFNSAQFKWIQIHNDSLLQSQQFKGTYSIPKNVVPYIGLTYENLSEKQRKSNKLDGKEGVCVVGVEEGSPAEVAMFSENDVILSVNGHVIKDEDDFSQFLADRKVGDVLEFSCVRKKKRVKMLLKVTWR